MLSSRKVAFSSLVLVALVAGGCDKFKKGGADGGADASDLDATAVTTATPDTTADAASPLTTATAVTPTVRPVVRTDGGVSDAGAAGDAGAVQECCCEATGWALESVGMSECNKTRKGLCVKKDRCAAVAAVDAGATPTTPTTPTTPGATDTCCCDTGPASKPAVVKTAECTGVKKGTCVLLSKCGMRFNRH